MAQAQAQSPAGNAIDLPPPIVAMIDEAIQIEVGGASDPGGYTNDPADPGGETRWGVTRATLLDSPWASYADDMPHLPRQIAVNLFTAKYVVKPGFLAVGQRSLELCGELVEAGINLGPDRPSRWFQRILNVMNVREGLYPDIAVDGAIGNNTLTVGLDGYLRTRDPHVITMQLNHLQGAEYQRLAEASERFERFIYGWVRQRTCVVEIPGKLQDAHLLAA